MEFHRSMLFLYWVAGTQDCRHLGGQAENNLLSTLEIALKNGITCFQLREKGHHALSNPAAIENLAHECRQLCHDYQVPLVINNDVELALKVQADGVHLGQSDLAIDAARVLCGRRLFIGRSNNNPTHFQNSLNTDVDYLAVGPVFPTQSKPDAAPAVGIDFVRYARSQTQRPLVAIGGITAQDSQAIRQAGADGIAVISAISHAPDVAMAVRLLAQ